MTLLRLLLFGLENFFFLAEYAKKIVIESWRSPTDVNVEKNTSLLGTVPIGS